MPREPAIPDEEFIKMFQTLGPSAMARHTGLALRGIFDRRNSIEVRSGIKINPPGVSAVSGYGIYPRRVLATVEDGHVLVASDAHYWPGVRSTAHRGFLKVIAEIKPKLIIMNGDLFDGASISRHPPIGWTHQPSVMEELDAVLERTEEIRAVAGPGTELIWTTGNHDARFENKLASQAPQYRGVHGTRLEDHFPHWKFCLAVWINDKVVVKHRFKGGIHATHNNTLWAGKTMVTGHLHSLKVTPFTDYNGTRWGVDTGTLAETDGPHTEYNEDNPANHRSGFVNLPFYQSELLVPEMAPVFNKDAIQFRGKVIDV